MGEEHSVELRLRLRVRLRSELTVASVKRFRLRSFGRFLHSLRGCGGLAFDSMDGWTGSGRGVEIPNFPLRTAMD